MYFSIHKKYEHDALRWKKMDVKISNDKNAV